MSELVVDFERFLPVSVRRPSKDRPTRAIPRLLRVLGDAGI
jgi:hypothetical protein